MRSMHVITGILYVSLTITRDALGWETLTSHSVLCCLPQKPLAWNPMDVSSCVTTAVS